MSGKNVKNSAIQAADAELNNAGLPTYTQLLVAIQHGVTTKQRSELDDDVRRNPGATDCGTFVLMTPVAWEAITAAVNAIDA